jgi:hypothetical protein
MLWLGSPVIFAGAAVLAALAVLRARHGLVSREQEMERCRRKGDSTRSQVQKFPAVFLSSNSSRFGVHKFPFEACSVSRVSARCASLS